MSFYSVDCCHADASVWWQLLEEHLFLSGSSFSPLLLSAYIVLCRLLSVDIYGTRIV